MHPTRRAMLSLSAAALAATSCAGKTPSQLATDVGLIASGLASVVTSLAQAPGVPAATLAQLQGWLATIEADAAQVAAASAGAGGVVEFARAVQALAAIALPLIPGGSAIAALIDAAMSLLPMVLGTVGISGAPLAAPVYAPDQARLILRAVR